LADALVEGGDLLGQLLLAPGRQRPGDFFGRRRKQVGGVFGELEAALCGELALLAGQRDVGGIGMGQRFVEDIFGLISWREVYARTKRNA
jgi:hypothetical protein